MSEALHLYADDGSHPTAEGTYVAAVVLIRATLGKMPELSPVAHVPLMDGAAKPNGSFVDIVPSAAGMTAIGQAVRAVYEASPEAQLEVLPVVPAAQEPTLPPEAVRGRASSSFLRGEWQGEFATFGPEYTATITLDLRGETPSVRMVHPEEGWPDDDVTTAVVHAADDDGVLAFTFNRRRKNVV